MMAAAKRHPPASAPASLAAAGAAPRAMGAEGASARARPPIARRWLPLTRCCRIDLFPARQPRCPPHHLMPLPPAWSPAAAAAEAAVVAVATVAVAKIRSVRLQQRRWLHRYLRRVAMAPCHGQMWGSARKKSSLLHIQRVGWLLRQLPWRLQRRRRQHLEISGDTSTPNGVALGSQLQLFETKASELAAVLTMEREVLAALAELGRAANATCR